MSERGTELARTADGQISELTEILSRCGEADLHLPCPGREKLGDGTVAACARHTTENYRRIAGLIQRLPITDDGSAHAHGARHSGEPINLPELLAQLAAARAAVTELARVEADRLDSVPAAGTVRFANGERTLEQVIAAALKHQEHQLDALKAAVAHSTRTPGEVPGTSTAPGPRS